MAKGFRYFAASGLLDVAFPLTPALSLGERESPRAAPKAFGASSNALRFAGRLATIPTLPKGEGRVEGEPAARPATTSEGSKFNCRGPSRSIMKPIRLGIIGCGNVLGAY